MALTTDLSVIENGPQRQPVFEGVCRVLRGERWLVVDESQALIGPLIGAELVNNGERAAVVISQDGTPFLIFPTAPSSGGDKTYIHAQGSASATWTVAHGLNKYPAVEVVDTGASVVIPDVIYLDTNNLTLLFASPTSGKAFCN